MLGSHVWHAFSATESHYLFSSTCHLPIRVPKEAFDLIVQHSAIQNVDASELLAGLSELAECHALPEMDMGAAPLLAPRLQVELLWAGRCNLCCDYCFARPYSSSPDPLAEDVYEATLAFMRGRLAADTEEMLVVLGLDGEPLLAPELVRRVGEDCLRLRDEFPNARVRCSVISNGSRFSESTIGLLEELDMDVGVSIDGPKEIHDAVRHDRNGGGSYDQILPGLIRAQSSSRVSVSRLTAFATLTARHPDPTAVIRHLVDMGFWRVAAKPARLPHDHVLALNETSLPRFLSGYEEYADFLRHALVSDLDRWRPVLNQSDFFGRFLLRLASRGHVRYRCPAGRHMVSVDANGRLFPCSSMACADLRAAIGDVRTGLFASWPAVVEELHVARKESCSGCFARRLCGGGCYHMAQLINDDLRKPDGVKCQLIRRVCELAASLVADLAETAPEALAEVVLLANAGNQVE